MFGPDRKLQGTVNQLAFTVASNMSTDVPFSARLGSCSAWWIKCLPYTARVRMKKADEGQFDNVE